MAIESKIEIECDTRDKKELEDLVISAVNRILSKYPNEKVTKMVIESYLYRPKHKIIESDRITNE